jgi:uncharacterized protein (TIGR02001 family)
MRGSHRPGRCRYVPPVLALAALLLAAAGPLAAAELPGELSATVTFATDYDYRGMSLSDRLPVGQASVDWALAPGPFLGVWTSNVDFGDGPSIELDYYGGVTGAWAGTDLSATILYYTYPLLDAVRSYPEIYLEAEHEVWRLRLSGFVAYTWDLNGAGSEGVYPRLTTTLPLPLPRGLGLAAHVGGQWASDPAAVGTPSYVDWSVGLTYELFGVDLTLAYVDTNLGRAGCGGTDNCAARAIFSASHTFSSGARDEERRRAVGRGY